MTPKTVVPIVALSLSTAFFSPRAESQISDPKSASPALGQGQKYSDINKMLREGWKAEILTGAAVILLGSAAAWLNSRNQKA